VVIAAAQKAGAEIGYSQDLDDGQVYGSVRAIDPFVDATRVQDAV